MRTEGFRWLRSDLGKLSKESFFSSDTCSVLRGGNKHTLSTCCVKTSPGALTEFYLILKKASLSQCIREEAEAHRNEVTCLPSPSQGKAAPGSEL